MATSEQQRAGAGGPRRGTLACLIGLLVAAVVCVATTTPALADPVDRAAVAPPTRGGGVNDPACRPSEAHPHPVVVLHGLGANSSTDLNVLQGWLADRGYCTFARTYGAYPQFPFVGGLRAIADSAAEIAAYVREVRATTGAAKVDLVGHSEGGFQSLFVPKTQDVAGIVGVVAAIAPPTNGTTFAGLVTVADRLNVRPEVDTALRTFGCVACTELTTGGSAVRTLNEGPVSQPGIDYTVITSRFDQLVTPPDTAFVREPGVTNQYVQDFCPADPVGHINEAYDTNVWNLVANALEGTPTRRFPCSAGLPG